MQNKKLKTALINIAVFAVITVLMTVIVEVAMRYRIGAWPFEPPAKKMSYLTEKDTDLKWRFSPGNGNNSLGLRNREVTIKDKGCFRVLFLGDSLVYYGDTSTGEPYTEVIEKELNKTTLFKKKIEVINAGVPGYGTFQELEFLERYGWDMLPDLVVLGFVFNDLYKYLHRPTEKGILDTEPSAKLYRFNTDSFPGTLFARSYFAHELYYLMQRRLRDIIKGPKFTFESRLDFYLAWKKYGWYNTDNLIREFSERLRYRNIPFAIVVFPVSEQVDVKSLSEDQDYVLYPQKRIVAICSKNNIRFVDLTEPIYKKGGPKLFCDYLHLNKEGNDVVAQVLTEYLKKLLIADGGAS